MNFRFLTALALVIGLATSVASAQSICFGNDGFSSGPCCTFANPVLPNFPALQTTGRAGVLKDCNVENQFPTGTVVQPQQVLCDYWIMNLSITSPQANIPTGFLVAKYARTWIEFGPNGPLQVWRFLVNGDLSYALTATSVAGNPIPLSAFPPYSLPVHFWGSLDYARDCTTLQWQVAYNLTHLCPTEMHAGYTARPIPAAAGWLKRTYHFVAPGNFNFANICPPPDGPVFGESIRENLMVPGIPYTCFNEVPIFQGTLANGLIECSCSAPPPVIAPARYTHQSLNGIAGCSGMVQAFNSVPIAGLLPNGLRALSLGAYVPTAGGAYPGNECVSVYVGVMQNNQYCPSPVLGSGPIKIVGGVGTTGGFPVQLYDSPIAGGNTSEFLDLENMLVLNTAGGWGLGIGALFASDIVFSINTL